MSAPVMNALSWLLVLEVFSGAFLLRLPFFDLRFIHLIGPAYIAAFAAVHRRFSLPRKLLLFLGAAAALSVPGLFLGWNTPWSFCKVFGNAALNAVAFTLLLVHHRSSPERLFRMYLKGAVVVLAIGLVQVGAFLLGVRPLYDFSPFLPGFTLSVTAEGLIRVSSILSEPSHFAVVMTPAVFAAVRALALGETLFMSRRTACLTLLGLFCSLSTLGYLGLVLCAVALLWRLRRGRVRLVLLALAAVLPALLYAALPDVRHRVRDGFLSLRGEDPSSLNLSTFTLVANARVAAKSLERTLGLGGGIGSHPVSYDRFIPAILNFDAINRHRRTGEPLSPLNREDGGSLFIRLLSESGLWGLAALVLFFRRYRVPPGVDPRWETINDAAMVHFALRFLRFGPYGLLGGAFFSCLYWASHEAWRNEVPSPLMKAPPAPAGVP